MPAYDELTEGSDPCALSAHWKVREDVIRKAIAAAIDFERETGRRVTIISGFRTEREQRALAAEGRPAAPDHLSNHRTCPATAIDVRLGFRPTRVLKATWGRIVRLHGLRWGGGSPVDSGGIPSDWNHVDVGPRAG